jgi:cytochrome P450
MSGSPVAWPLLGHLPAFQADTTGFLLRLARERGDVARFRLGRREAILLSNPQHVRDVLIEQAAAFTKGRLMQRARRLLGNGLLTSEGSVHHVQRRRIQPVFARDRLEQYAAQVPEIVARQTARWRSGRPVRVDLEMDRLAMTVVARTLLGADIEAEAPELGVALRRLSRWAPLLLAPGGRVLERTRLPLLRQLREAMETVEGVIPVEQVMTIFLAGHDTTAAALTWTWLLLSTHPEIEARLHQEISDVLGDRQPCATDVSSLLYTEMVIKETLRLYPPVGRIGRRPIRDVKLNGITLPRDSAVFLSPFVTQRDPRWFPQPDEFHPERWAEPAPDRPRFAWFPFGAGPRSCVGEHFARVVLVLAVAAIARNWRLGGATRLPKVRSLLTLKPRGAVWLVAERIAPRAAQV